MFFSLQVAYMVPTCGLMVAAYLAEESPCWLMATYELRNAEHVLSRAAGANRVEPPVFRRRLSALRDEMCRQHCHSVTQQEQERANVTVTDPGDHFFRSTGDERVMATNLACMIPRNVTFILECSL